MRPEAKSMMRHASALFMSSRLMITGTSVAVVLADGGGVPEVPRCALSRSGGRLPAAVLVTRGFIVVLDSLPSSATYPSSSTWASVMLDEAEPSAGVALHYADLRRYELVHPR